MFLSNILIKKIKSLNTFQVFIFFVICLVIVNFLYSQIYKNYSPNLIDANGNYIITNIGFVFGKTISSLINNHSLSLSFNDFLSTWGLKSEIDMELNSSRRPLLPLIYIFINNYISTNFTLFHLAKNLFFGILIFFSINSLKRNYNAYFLIICLFLIYYNPHNTITMLSTQFEEGILNYLIILLFVILINEIQYKEIYLSLILVSIFFLKGSMFLLVLLIPLFYFFYEKKNKFKIFLILSVIISNLAWGYINFNKNKFFAIGLNGSSMNAINMTLVTNDLFNQIYPTILPDILMAKTIKIVEENNLQNERDLTNYLINRSTNYIIKNPLEYFKGVLKKIYVLNFSPYKDARMPGSMVYDGVELKSSSSQIKYDEYLTNIENNNEKLNPKILNPIRYSNFPNKIIFNISIILMLISFIKQKKNLFFNKLNIYYFIILATYLAPYMYGWIYPRHATSVYTLAHLYCLFYLIENKPFIKKLFIN